MSDITSTATYMFMYTTTSNTPNYIDLDNMPLGLKTRIEQLKQKPPDPTFRRISFRDEE